MSNVGKRYGAAAEAVTRVGSCDLAKAIEVAKSNAVAKFDETMEMAVRLGVDPKHADQMVRGTVVLPHGTGKSVRVLVFAKGEQEKEARDAGADYVGCEDLIEKIQQGWLEFERAIATPNVMGLVGRLGKVLGPRGLMPNPKTGTVTFDVGRAVREFKGGKIEYRTEKRGSCMRLSARPPLQRTSSMRMRWRCWMRWFGLNRPPARGDTSMGLLYRRQWGRVYG